MVASVRKTPAPDFYADQQVVLTRLLYRVFSPFYSCFLARMKGLREARKRTLKMGILLSGEHVSLNLNWRLWRYFLSFLTYARFA